MSLSSLFKRQPTIPPQKPLTPDEIKRNDVIVDLIYAGHEMGRHLWFPNLDGTTQCLCGVTVQALEKRRINHHRCCPVARFIAAVEVVRKEVL